MSSHGSSEAIDGESLFPATELSRTRSTGSNAASILADCRFPSIGVCATGGLRCRTHKLITAARALDDASVPRQSKRENRRQLLLSVGVVIRKAYPAACSFTLCPAGSFRFERKIRLFPKPLPHSKIDPYPLTASWCLCLSWLTKNASARNDRRTPYRPFVCCSI
jgi:hypothetical protein